jgi:hypothetical protein
MSPGAARIAELRDGRRVVGRVAVTAVAVAAGTRVVGGRPTTAHVARCTRRFARRVARTRKCRSSRAVTSRSTARTASPTNVAAASVSIGGFHWGPTRVLVTEDDIRETRIIALAS